MKKSKGLSIIIILAIAYIVFPLILSLLGLDIFYDKKAEGIIANLVFVGTPVALFLAAILMSHQSFRSEKVIRGTLFLLGALFLLMVIWLMVNWGFALQNLQIGTW
ncbi:hypothetical protein KJ591_01865 [Patescibacteria group bacterium]|nr:hypothetical protein [Patescibacteria group bacterium]